MEDSRAGKKNDNKTGKREKMFFALLIFILFFPIVFFSALEWFINADFFSIGISGFAQTVIVNVCFGLLALIGPDGSLKEKLGRKRLREGRALWSGNDYNLYAKVSYLPHTSTVMTLEFITELDGPTGELFPASDDLPKDWESFSIQINSDVYTFPTPLVDFLDDGWKLSEEDEGLFLDGADRPYASYEREWISLTNAQEQTIDVLVFNSTEDTITVAESTVGGVYVIYGNYDFSGTQLRIPGGLMLGWSTKEDVLELYGQPDKSFESVYGAYSLTYQTDDPIDKAYWKLEFDASGILENVMVHHQAYFRSD